MKKQNNINWMGILIAIFIILAIFGITFYLSQNKTKFNIYEKIFTNYTVQEEQENHSFAYYNTSIDFILAPIEDYSVSSIVSLIPLNTFKPICDKNSIKYHDRFCSPYSGCHYPEDWIHDIQDAEGCFKSDTTQRIVSYFVINNSNIRQVGDALKNLDTKKQNITIIIEIENNTKYYTEIDVIKTNETEALIRTNLSYNTEIILTENVKGKLNKDWLNANASCINSHCPEGFEEGYPGEDCWRCGSICDFFGLDWEQKPKICDKWNYQDKYIIEEIR